MKRACQQALPWTFWLLTGVQVSNASEIFGMIWDPTGSALPHAEITASNTETGIEHRTESGEAGRYSVPFLKPGPYSLSVRSAGFMISTVPHIELTAGKQLRVDVTLLLATVAESIHVTDVTLLDTASSEVGETVPGNVIRHLPLNGRNFTELLTLSPGITPVSSAQGSLPGTTDAEPTGIPGSRVLKPSLHGQQNRSVIYYLDGIVNTDFRVTTYSYLPNIDLLDSMRVHSHSDKVEWGGVTGGVVSLTSKSGTNEFRGTLFSFVRNSAFDARDPFKDATSDGPAAFRQNQFGATYSGPIVRNRSFFAAGYEAWRYRKPTQSLGRVPTVTELAGDFSESVIGQPIFDPFSTRLDAGGSYVRTRFPGNRIPGSLLSQRMVGFFELYEERPNLVDPVSNFINSASSADDADSLQVKIDHRFSDEDSIFGRWSRLARHSVEHIGQKSSNGSDMVATNMGGGWLRVFGPTVALSLRGGVARRDFLFDVQDHVEGLHGLAQLGFRDTERFQGLQVALTSPWGTSGVQGAAPRENPTFNIAGDLTVVRGGHTLKFGGQWMAVERLQGNTFQIFRFADQVTGDPQSPGVTGASLASALLGLPSSFDGFLPDDGTINFRVPTYSAYVQDEWRASSRLTLNYGVRFDYSRPATILNDGMMGGIDIDRQVWLIGAASMPGDCSQRGRAPCIPDEAPHRDRIALATPANFLPNPVRDNWGPRIGAAYRLDEGTVLRGGYGLYWDALTSNSQYTQHNINTWPVSSGFNGKANDLGEAPQSISDLEGNFPAVLPAANPWVLDTWSNDPQRKNGYSHQWHVELQRQVTEQLMASAAYVGSTNRRGEYAGLGNSATVSGPGTPEEVNARRPFPEAGGGIFYSRSIGESSYHALQLKARRRFSEGLQMLLSYTWSKSMDNGSSGWFGAENGPGGSSAAQNYHDPASNRSVSSYNIPHFLSFYSVYELPVGTGRRYLSRGPAAWVLGNWQANMILQWRSGQPYNLEVPGDVANIGNSVAWWNYARPNLVGDPRAGAGTAERFYNPAAFDVPSLSYGNFGRNVLSADPVFNTDFSLFKVVPLTERRRLEIRLEAFNVFNHIDWAPPGTLVGRAGAGRVSATAHAPRVLQLGIKLHF
ncbi:MAG: TonB-dependent receptor [Bryobacterales bacterium]|nr:TonB-dependent receptor [Bryobacterales bacterium]